MVFTRVQLDTLSWEELVGELIKCSNIADQIKTLTDRFDEFVGKGEKLQSDLVISKNCNFLIVNSIINLERNALSNGQYIRGEMLGIYLVSHSINTVDLEEKVCEALPVTDTEVKPDDLDACHRTKKFKNRKQRNDVILEGKELKSKGDGIVGLW